MLSDDELAGLRKRFFEATGAHCLPEERPTDEQLSALAHLIRTQPGHRAVPFVEFAVWGPFAARSAKSRVFSAHVLSREGTWQVRARTGPASFAAWEASYHVMAAAFIMLNIASPGALKAYHQAIRKLAGLYPQELWPTIASLEEEVRSERWNRVRQEIADGITAAPHNYDPAMPWQTLVAAARPYFLLGLLADWWQDRIILLDRACSTRQLPKPSAPSVVPGVLPSFIGQPVLPAIAGGRALALEDAAPTQPNHNNSAPRGSRKRRNRQPAPNQPPAKQQKQAETRTCHNCGQVGHIQANCPHPPSGRGRGRGNRGRGRGRGRA